MRDKSLIDASILLAQFDGDQTTVQSIFRAFAEFTEDYAIDVQSALSARNLESLQAIAHKVKSASYSIGANNLGDSCYCLEEVSRSGEADRAWQQAEQVLEQLSAAKDYIYHYLL